MALQAFLNSIDRTTDFKIGSIMQF